MLKQWDSHFRGRRQDFDWGVFCEFFFFRDVNTANKSSGSKSLARYGIHQRASPFGSSGDFAARNTRATSITPNRPTSNPLAAPRNWPF